jgi:hypothetical protein
MCMICSTIPAAMALGVSAQAKQNHRKREAETRGETSPKPFIPAGPATAAVVVVLIFYLCSGSYPIPWLDELDWWGSFLPHQSLIH